MGGEYDSIMYLSSRYSGMKSFGTLFGVIGSGLLAGVGLGPLLAGAVYDFCGNYDLFLSIAVAMSLTTAILLDLLGRYPAHD